jgi:hypothetical protein
MPATSIIHPVARGFQQFIVPSSISKKMTTPKAKKAIRSYWLKDMVYKK